MGPHPATAGPMRTPRCGPRHGGACLCPEPLLRPSWLGPRCSSVLRAARHRLPSLLLITANPEVLRHPVISGIAARAGATLAQVVFRFTLPVGILPLAGTSSAGHMRQDLASRDRVLSSDDVQAIADRLRREFRRSVEAGAQRSRVTGGPFG